CRGDGRPFGGRLGGLCLSPLPFRLGFFPLWLLDCCRFRRRRFTLRCVLLEGRGGGLGFQGSDGWAALGLRRSSFRLDGDRGGGGGGGREGRIRGLRSGLPRG